MNTPKFVIRQLRADEDPSQGLHAKDPEANRSLRDHVRCGSKPHYKDQYISVSTNLLALEDKTRELKTPRRYCLINLEKLPKSCTVYNHDDPIVATWDNIPQRYWNKSGELAITGDIPAEACNLIFDEVNGIIMPYKELVSIIKAYMGEDAVKRI